MNKPLRSVKYVYMKGILAVLSSVAAEAQVVHQRGVLEETVVTAQKRAENINDVGMSISAFTGEDLLKRAVSDPSDLAKIVAGFSYAKSNYGTPVYTMRGVGFYDTSLGASPTVSVYVDEVPLPFSIMTRGASLDLERVEVLKGPQGTVFGQNSTGGAVNYIAARPTNDLRAGFDLDAGRFNKLQAQGFVSGALSDTVNARLSVRKDIGGAWQESATRHDDELGDSDLTIARLLLDWEPSDRVSVKINVNGWMDNSDTQSSQLIKLVGDPEAMPPELVASPLAKSENRITDWDPDTVFKRDDKFFQGAARIDYALNENLNLTSITSYESLSIDAVGNPDGTAVQNYTSDNWGEIESFFQELRLSGEASQGRVNWVLGINYQEDNTEDHLTGLTRDSTFPFDSSRVEAQQSINTYAGFANVSWDMAEDITLQGGIRYTDQENRFEGCVYDTGAGDLSAVFSGIASKLTGTSVTIPPGGCVTLDDDFFPGVVHNSLEEDNVSWRVGMQWELEPEKLLYANVSRGYKSGSFSTAGASRSLQYLPATQESLLAYEAGFKVGLADRTLQLNGALYYYDYSDKQIRGKVLDPIFGPLNTLLNIPESRIAGGEIQVDWLPLDSLRITGAASYNDTKITDHYVNYTTYGDLVDFDGESFPLTPEWQVNGDAEYQYQVGELFAFVGGSVVYQSKTNAALGEIPELDIKDSTIFDARAGLQSADNTWSVTAYIRNIGDTYYWNNVVTVLNTTTRYAAMPRTWGLTVRYRY